MAIALVIPFTSISSICRSYFFGKERMGPHVISNLVEDVVRLGLMIICIPFVIAIAVMLFFVSSISCSNSSMFASFSSIGDASCLETSL